eukprot:XP_001700865.1 predicted protein [Chlamydomonas reinhardtii]
MELRQLANVLYSMGKLRLELSKEQLGPHLTEHIESRLGELLDRKGFGNELDLTQLWYGLALCKFQWDSELLTRLVAGTIGEMEAWESMTGAGDTLANMAQLAESITLTDQQKQDLVGVIGALTDRVDLERRDFHALSGTVWATRSLQLAVPKPQLRRQVNLLLAAPRPLSVRRSLVSRFLENCSKLGAKPETPAEAQDWFELLKDAGPAEWKVEEIRWGLGTLATIDKFSPSPEVKQMVLDAAASKGVRSAADAGVLLQLSEAWGIALPAEVCARLVRMRGSGGPKP